jgi:hypothetical protein
MAFMECGCLGTSITLRPMRFVPNLSICIRSISAATTVEIGDLTTCPKPFPFGHQCSTMSENKEASISYIGYDSDILFEQVESARCREPSHMPV